MATNPTVNTTPNVLYVPVMRELALNGCNVLDAMEIGWKVKNPAGFKYLVAVGSNGAILGAGKIVLHAAELDDKGPNGRYWFKVYLHNDSRLSAADNRTLAKIKASTVAIGTGKKLTNMQNCAFGIV